MSYLSINFSGSQRGLHRTSPALGWALLLAGMAALGYSGLAYHAQTGMHAGLVERRQSLRQSAQAQLAPTPASPELLARIEDANAGFALLQTPWDEIFLSLESARSQFRNDIVLLSVKVDSLKRELALGGEARDFTVLSGFNAALASSARFSHVTLASDKLSESAPPPVVSFDLRIGWHAPTQVVR